MPQYELDLQDYIQVVQRRKVVVFGVFFFVALLTIIFTNKQVPVYRATAMVKIMERKTFAGLLAEAISYSPGDPIASQARLIKSFPVMERVIRDLGLVNPNADQDELARVITSLQNKVSTQVLGETNVISIMVEDTNAKRVALIANKIAEAYIDENLKEKNAQARTVREFIQGQLKEVAVKLTDSEEAFKKFRESGEATGIAIPLQNKLADLETERSKLLRMYTEQHPDIVRINEEVSLMKEQLKSIPDKELQYARLTREQEINEKLYRNLQEKFEEARIAEVEKVPDVGVVNPALIPVAPVRPNKMVNGLLGIVVGLVLGLTLGFTVEHMDTSIGTIEEVESILKLPVLGIIPFLSAKEGGKKKIWQKIWPRRQGEKEELALIRSQLIIHYSLRSPEMEALRILRANIKNELAKSGKIKIILMTSSSPEEGKSIISSNLAAVFAQEGMKTLLIDADMRRSVIHKVFGLKNKEPGLSDVLRGTATLEDAMRTITDIMMGEVSFDATLEAPGLDNLHILTAGSIPTIPTELLSSPNMDALFDKLREKFDIILVDSPPVLAVADPAVLAPKVDNVIMVYRVGQTAKRLLLRAQAQLQELNAKIMGVILNNISQEIELRYGYYHRYRYYKKYYGEKGESEKET